MTATDIESRYFSWLYRHIGSASNPNPDHGHWLLAEQLHKISFEWFIPNDDNRASDGVALREEFLDTTRASITPYGFLDSPCSVFEMLLALAKRLDYEADGMDLGEGMGEWFWTLMNNVGLRKYTDSSYLNYAASTERKVAERVRDLLSRNYEESGRGGLFPLKAALHDQRKVELWYQMSEYLMEQCV